MKLPPLSNRLQACCSFVHPGDRVADIGCDHGYLGIHLLQNGIASAVIASDVKEGPLSSAQRNARRFGVADKISFFLSDGVECIPKEFDTLVCAGMGADTMISILDAAPWLRSKNYRLILQCQSRRPELRRYLYAQGFSIRSETLAEDGKFIYPVMEVVYCPSAPLSPGSEHISPALLSSGSKLLIPFYDRILNGVRTTIDGLSRNGGEKLKHYQTVLSELLEMEDTIYGNGS